MPLFNEKSLIEDYFVEQLQVRSGRRWRFVGADELEREAVEEPLLTAAFIRALKSLNKDIGIGDDEIKQVLNELKLRGSGSEDSKKILNYFKDGVPIKFEKERVVKYVKLFDYDNIGKQRFCGQPPNHPSSRRQTNPQRHHPLRQRHPACQHRMQESC